MASKNIFSDGYTQLPVRASAPVSVSWFEGRSISAPGELERGMVETSRSWPRALIGFAWGEEEDVVVIGLLGFEEALLKKGMRQPQPEGEVASCC